MQLVHLQGKVSNVPGIFAKLSLITLGGGTELFLDPHLVRKFHEVRALSSIVAYVLGDVSFWIIVEPNGALSQLGGSCSFRSGSLCNGVEGLNRATLKRASRC
jgi:hypothetical protein